MQLINYFIWHLSFESRLFMPFRHVFAFLICNQPQQSDIFDVFKKSKNWPRRAWSLQITSRYLISLHFFILDRNCTFSQILQWNIRIQNFTFTKFTEPLNLNRKSEIDGDKIFTMEFNLNPNLWQNKNGIFKVKLKMYLVTTLNLLEYEKKEDCEITSLSLFSNGQNKY